MEDVEDEVSCFVDVEDECDVTDEAVVDTVIEEISADVEAVLKSEASVIIARFNGFDYIVGIVSAA